MEEIWKDIENYEGCYQVSNLGNIRSLDRWIYHSNDYEFFKKRKSKKLTLSNQGYYGLNLFKSGIRKGYSVARLVAIHFIPNPNKLPEVNHIDGNKLNNSTNNLEWVTNLENCRHAWKIGLKNANHARGSSNNFTKLNEEIVIRIRNFYDTKQMKYSELLKYFDISPTVLKGIIRRKTWKHI